MAQSSERVNPPDADARTLPRSRRIAVGATWALNEYVCTAGPDDRPFEEKHDVFTIAAVVDGMFNYRSNAGDAFLHAGAILLGNHGHCFECGHKHSRGDRCIALHVSPQYFEEIAASAAGQSAFKFPALALPAAPEFAPLSAALSMARADLEDERRFSDGLRQIWGDTVVTGFVADLVARLSGRAPRGGVVSASDVRRVARVLDYLTVHTEGARSLDALANVAAMSKFHFLRTFQRVTGVTPHQYMLGLRLRRAAEWLKCSRAPIADIAFDAGFPDLSTFNRQFRMVFGQSPKAYRTQGG